MRRIAAVLLLVGPLLAACGDDGGSAAGSDADADEPSAPAETTTTAGADNDVVCEHLGTVERLDTESGRVSDSAIAQMNAGADPAVVIAALHESADLIESGLPEIAAAYAAAAAAADPDVAADIEALAESTATLSPTIVGALRSVSSVEDLAAMEQAFDSPEFLATAQAAAASAQSLNRYTEVVCGFTITD
jgi:hypothetical protein